MPKAKTTERNHPSKMRTRAMALWLCGSAFTAVLANPNSPTPAVVAPGTVTTAPNADMQQLIEAARIRKAKEWQEQSKKAINPGADVPALAAPIAIPAASLVPSSKTNELEQPRVWSILVSAQSDVTAEVLYQEKIYTVHANRPVRMGPWHMVSLNSQQLVMRRDLTAAEKKKWPRQLKAAERKSLEVTGVQVELFAPDPGISMESYFPDENESDKQTHSNNFVLPASALRAANLPVAAAMPGSAQGMSPFGSGNSLTSPVPPKFSGPSPQPAATGKR